MENLDKINTFHFHYLVQYTKVVCRQRWSSNLLIVRKLFTIVTKEKGHIKRRNAQETIVNKANDFFAPRHLSLIAR